MFSSFFKRLERETFTVERLNTIAMDANEQQQMIYIEALQISRMKPIKALRLRHNIGQIGNCTFKQQITAMVHCKIRFLEGKGGWRWAVRQFQDQLTAERLPKFSLPNVLKTTASNIAGFLHLKPQANTSDKNKWIIEEDAEMEQLHSTQLLKISKPD